MTSVDKKEASITVRSRASSGDSTDPPTKSPRLTRFAEATSVESPVESTHQGHPFSFMSNHYLPQPQPADVGFGYLANSNVSNRATGINLGVEMPASPQSPLKSALKTSNTVPRNTEENPLSPTFREEQILERREESTEKEQAKDLKVKVRVRVAKMLLRCTNFACSLIVLSMLSTTFTIFETTRAIPPRNDLPPWAIGTKPWPQITLLVISCISLFMSVVIFYAYSRGGHQRAERAAVYYTTFSVAFFTFSIIMWGVGAGILHSSKANGKGKDLWGWSCKDNTRKALFEQEVSYSLICRLQNWSLVCALIEVVVETITILIYGIVFYRFYSKRKLRISMAQRDAARSELYLAQSRVQSAVNTPAFPMSAREGGYNPMFLPRCATDGEKKDASVDHYSMAEEGRAETVRYISAEPQAVKPFTLQAAPVRNTPKPFQQNTFEQSLDVASVQIPRIPEALRMVTLPSMAQPSARPVMSPGPTVSVFQSTIVHTPAAPGEIQYAEVPIPAAYPMPIRSPGPVPASSGY